jgi:hypothetical protein
LKAVTSTLPGIASGFFFCLTHVGLVRARCMVSTEIVYAHGGSGMFVVSKEDAEKSPPRTRLHQLYEACFMDLNNATLMGLMTLIRWQNAGESKKILKLFSELRSCYRFRENRFPWLVTD